MYVFIDVLICVFKCMYLAELLFNYYILLFNKKNRVISVYVKGISVFLHPSSPCLLCPIFTAYAWISLGVKASRNQ